MADHGIGGYLRNAAIHHFRLCRDTGRTHQLVESLNDGDRVIFLHAKEAKRVERMARDRGVTIEIVVCDPGTPYRIVDRPPCTGRVIFDHCWVEQYYADCLRRGQENLWSLQKAATKKPDNGPDTRQIGHEFE